MKQPYKPPGLVRYGTVAQLTLGSGGTAPDFDTSLVLVNNNCTVQTFIGPDGRQYTTVACINNFAS